VSDVAAVSLPEQSWAQALGILRDARDATLVCHLAPDGDALGSMLALARALRANGTEVTCTWGDERWSVPTAYHWLPDIDRVVPPSEVPPAPSVMVVLDTASRDRLGVLGDLADRAGALVVIDHHAHNSGLAGVQLVDPRAAATAVVVEELLRRMGADVDVETATLLYTGLVTDTGSFQHPVTTPAVHAVAGRLLADGAKPQAIAQHLWGTRDFGILQIFGTALSRAALEESAAGGRGLVWTWVGREDLAAAGAVVDDIESAIDFIRAARQADVAAVLKQDVDGTFRVSTRSRGATDVGAACATLGGGGHKLAAGFTSYDDVDTTIARLRAALDAAPAPAP
jgi:bifunctional oligoribonuclease and PAP phosphatase NrnA